MSNLIIRSARVLRNLFPSRDGAVTVILAIALSMLMGILGLTFDIGWWYLTQRNFQGAADAAAVSVAVAYAAGNTSTSNLLADAQAIAAQHGVPNVTHNVSVTYPYTDGTTACPTNGSSDCLEVLISESQPPWFSRLVGFGNATIGAKSVVQVSHQHYCMLALNQGRTSGISIVSAISGTSIDMPNCSIGDNASGSTAFVIDAIFSALNLTAYSATVAGSEQQNCFLAACSLTFTKTPKYNATAPAVPIADPYGSVTMPSPGTASSITGLNPKTSSCSPGTAITNSTTLISGSCYSGINITGNVTVTGPAGNYTILAPANKAAISVGCASGHCATLTIGNGTIWIQGGSGQPAINVSGGSVSIGTSGASSTISILGQGTGGNGIAVSGGAFSTIGNTTNNIQGAAASAISVSGGTLTLGSATGTTNNTILGTGPGSAGIALSGTGQMIMGTGTNNAIQGGTNTAAISLSGTGHLATDDGGTFVIGPASPTTYGVVVNTNNPACGFAQFGLCSAEDLALGAGTYTIMGGIEVTGGNLTLNANGTSVGTYILYGNVGACGISPYVDPNVGLCMQVGDLNAVNSTIVLTGNSTSGYATFASGEVINTGFGYSFGWGAGDVNLNAPSTGTTSGIAIFQDRNAPSGGSNTFGGINSINLQGALYFPAQNLTFAGLTFVGVGRSSCYQFIASTIDIYSLFDSAFDDTGCSTKIVGTGANSASLVE